MSSTPVAATLRRGVPAATRAAVRSGNDQTREIETPTPVYYGAIGVMNAPHMFRTTGRPSAPKRIVAALRSMIRRLGDWRGRRGTTRRLARSDERPLADIGMTRGDLDQQ
jgi:uncharacterized protein YjiS (DUF1127 family)